VQGRAAAEDTVHIRGGSFDVLRHFVSCGGLRMTAFRLRHDPLCDLCVCGGRVLKESATTLLLGNFPHIVAAVSVESREIGIDCCERGLATNKDSD
ncbi:MAG: hypothetical protein QOC81_4574, partial [Thermoanaerobaculia bacterium]|nr:hypothetical protein [Thermoanaerobaculia bacterium]